MKGFLFALYFIAFVGSLVCFFWALNYRTDNGEKGPPPATTPSQARANYGPKGGKIAFIGYVCFLASGILGVIFYLID